MSDEAKEETERPVVLAYSLLFMYGFLLLSCLRRCAKLDHEQYAQHQDDPNRETDPGVLGEAGNQISDKGNGCGNQRIRKLGSHVVYVVALCARTCHDGGIRMGEQWSPQTAPAMQADMEMIINCGLVFANTATTMGIRIPKVTP